MPRHNIPDNEVWAWGGALEKPDSNRFEKGNESGQTAKPPKHTHFNWESKRADENMQYILRNATMPWDKDEKYPVGARVTRASKEYECIKESTNNDPATSSTYWEWIDNKHLPDASLTQKGIVKLSSSTTSDSESEAATPKAVHAVKKAADGAQETASKAVKKSGDTMTGGLTINDAYSAGNEFKALATDKKANAVFRISNEGAFLAYSKEGTDWEGYIRVNDEFTYTRGTVTYKVFHEGNEPKISQVTGLTEALADKPYWRQGTIDLSDKPTNKFYVVHFSQGKNNVSYRSDFFIRGGSGSGGDPYVDSILSGFFQSSGWSSIRPYFNLDWTPYSETKTCIHSVWHGNQSFIGMVVYLRGGFSYHVGTSSSYKLHESDVTLGDSLFPSGVLDPKQGGTNRDIDLYFRELGIGNYVKGDFYAAGRNMYANYFLSLADKQDEAPNALTRKDYVDHLVTDSINNAVSPHMGKTAVGTSVQANDVAGESYQEFYDYGSDDFDLVSFDPSKYETHIYHDGYYLVDVVVMRGEIVVGSVSGINVTLKVNNVEYIHGFVGEEFATKRNPILMKRVLKLRKGDVVRVYSDQDAKWQSGGSITFQYLRPLDATKDIDKPTKQPAKPRNPRSTT